MRKLLLIVVNGYPQSGKDTFVNYCRKYLEDKDFHTHNVSSVDPIKKAAKLIGWDGTKDDKGRNFLSELKDLSTKYYDFPFKHMLHEIETRRFPDEDHCFFFHIREPEEIKKFVEYIGFPVTTIFIERKDSIKHLTNTGDANVKDYKYNYIIYNDK